MICRTLLVCAAAVFIALSTTVSSFTSNTNPSRGTQKQLLKGSAPSRTTSTSHSALYAVKKAAKKKAPAKNKDGSDVVNFKKADFVSAVAEKTGMTKAESDLALAAVLNVIATEVADGKRISLPGFGTFKLNFRAARKGRNPATGEEIDIKSSYSPSFSASKTFKEICNPNR